MPRYFFHTHVGADVIADPAGVELADPDEAWEAARHIARAALAGPRDPARLLTGSLVVTDVAGEVVLEFPFSEAADLPPAGGPIAH